jgi:hypothetical protein
MRLMMERNAYHILAIHLIGIAPSLISACSLNTD